MGAQGTPRPREHEPSKGWKPDWAWHGRPPRGSARPYRHGRIWHAGAWRLWPGDAVARRGSHPSAARTWVSTLLSTGSHGGCQGRRSAQTHPRQQERVGLDASTRPLLALAGRGGVAPGAGEGPGAGGSGQARSARAPGTRRGTTHGRRLRDGGSAPGSWRRSGGPHADARVEPRRRLLLSDGTPWRRRLCGWAHYL
jgi:hypothetical protein